MYNKYFKIDKSFSFKFSKTFLLTFLLASFIFQFIISTYSYASDSVYVWSDVSKNVSSEISKDNDRSNKDSDHNALGLESTSAVLIEQSTGQILYSHNMNERLRPASVTKIMTILLIMEAIDGGKISLDDKIPCSQNASSMGGSQIWLDPEESLTVHEMLKAICVVSANDCCVAMSEYIGGSEDSFVEMMNNKAKELGMINTTFKNCHGLDEDGHVTSSYDIALMSKELLKNHPSITQYTTIRMDSLRDGKSELVNTNKLINSYDGITGLKTGSTGLALYNLSASATRDDLSLIAVIMKAPSTKIRFEEAKKLLNYGFNNFIYKEFAKKNDVLQNINILKGSCDFANVVFEEDSGVLIEKGKENKIEQIVTIPEIINAPIISGQKIGEVSYLLDGNTLLTSNLIINTNIDKLNILLIGKNIFYKWLSLLRN